MRGIWSKFGPLIIGNGRVTFIFISRVFRSDSCLRKLPLKLR